MNMLITLMNMNMCLHICMHMCHPLSLSDVQLLVTMDCSLPGSSVHGSSLGKNTGVGGHAILQGIFPTQGSVPGLSHCRQILYPLSHQRSPCIHISSVQLLSCVRLCSPIDCSMPGFRVQPQLLELTQTCVHRVSDAIQPSHPLLSPSHPAFKLSLH